MKSSAIIYTAILLGAACATASTSAQTPNSTADVKFSKAEAPVSNQSATASQPAKQFYHATYAGAAWGDFDNNGRLDLFYSDCNPLIDGSAIQSNLYVNSGNGTFSRITKSPFEGTAYACPIWFDANNDGWLDMLLVGLRNYQYKWTDFTTNLNDITAHLYISKGADANGNISYEDVSDCGIIPIFNGLSGGKGHNWISVGDYDKDGLTDVVMIGFDDRNRINEKHYEDALRVMYLYKNIDGTHFELQRLPLKGEKPFHGLTDGSVMFYDLDGDGWLDLLSTGYGYSRTSEIHIYWNNHDGTFTESDQHFRPVSDSSCSIFDLNNDGLPDIVFSGVYKNTSTKYFYICQNLGNRTFEMLNENTFEGMDGVQLSFGDVNQDGLADILVSGHGATNGHTTLIYINQGDFNFEAYGAHYNDPFGKKGHFSRITHGSNALVDVNGNGYLDAWISGWSASGCSKGCDTELWLNECSAKGIAANTAPSAPTNLEASFDSSSRVATFSWTASSDDFTPAGGLRYNIFIRRKDSDKTFMIIPANISTGFIKIGNITGALHQRTYQTKLPDEGEYEWGVQAIDNGNMGGVFTTSTLTTSGIGDIVNDVATNIWSDNHAIHFSANTASRMSIYNVNGQCIGTTESLLSGHMNVPEDGIYIVSVSNNLHEKRMKIAVK